MAVRLLAYIGLVYQDLISAKDPIIKKQGILPPIFPLVLYTGAAPWNSPLRLKDCFGDSIPGSLKKYQPDLQYMVLDIGRMTLDKYPAKADNFVKPIIDLEKLVNKIML